MNMKNTRILILAVVLLITQPVIGHTNLNFNSVTVTSEGAILLSFDSTPNEFYTVQYTDSLIGPNTGTTPWQDLYTYYPSHGTNTFVGDYGHYDLDPSIVHPRFNPMRFYRIVNQGTNDGPAPYVVISSLTNGSVLSGEVTVSVVATSTFPILHLQLYVDGQQMYLPENETNFVINTSEWANGEHTLFATCMAQSRFSGPSGYWPITIGRAVSPYVSVTFDNLIYKIAFSEPNFEPSLGQTQRVTASFAANVDWTLEIVHDDTSNVVRTVTGSGTSMSFDWDGTGNGGTNIADGVYMYYFTATTNGLEMLQSAPLNTSRPLPSFSGATMDDSTSEDWLPTSPRQAIMAGLKSYYLRLPPPPPLKTEQGWIPFEPRTVLVEIPESQQLALLQSLSTRQTLLRSEWEGPSSQSAAAPKRPPIAPMKNFLNNFGVGFYTYKTPVTRNNPKNGMPYPSTQTIKLDSDPGNQSSTDFTIEAQNNSMGMVQAMKKHSWKRAFHKFDDSLPINRVRRGDQGYNGDAIFTQATIGLFMAHGSYGTTLDYSPGAIGSYQTYFPSGCSTDGTGESSWLRMCQFGFGGNLKWMGILACNSLCDPNYASMVSHGAIPLKETHLLCGAASVVWMSKNIAEYWTVNMLKHKQKITDAWFNAAIKDYGAIKAGTISNTIILRVTGYPECMDDTVYNYTDPTNPSPNPGNLEKEEQQVYPQ